MVNYFSYWLLPVVAGLTWTATLFALLLNWIVAENRVHYPSMSKRQTLAFISDTGAYRLKPLFIAGSAVCVILFDLGIIIDWWLRYRGRLISIRRKHGHVLAGFSIFFALIGAAGLILLTIYDTFRYPRIHVLGLFVFLGGYIISALFICWEYNRLGFKNKDHPILRASFWVKLVFVVVEVALCGAFIGIAFGGGNLDTGAVIEYVVVLPWRAVCVKSSQQLTGIHNNCRWVIAFLYCLYVLSFAMDLWPAIHTKHNRDFRPRGNSKGSHAVLQETTPPTNSSHPSAVNSSSGVTTPYYYNQHPSASNTRLPNSNRYSTHPQPGGEGLASPPHRGTKLPYQSMGAGFAGNGVPFTNVSNGYAPKQAAPPSQVQNGTNPQAWASRSSIATDF